MGQYSFFTSNELRPKGWLRRQLEIQAEGLSGNLDKMWRDVRDSKWIGGDAEGWERVPYWLDGFIPLAYLLEDEDMIGRAKKYVDAILAQQKESGWICPCTDEEIPTYDTWAVQLISKVLVVYYECSGDERIPHAVYRALKNYHELLKNGTIHLFSWGKSRWFETMIAIRYLKDRFDEAWLDELAVILKEQGFDYTTFMPAWKRPLNRWTQYTHIVNLAMMLKAEAVTCDVLGTPYTDEAETLRNFLAQYNGTPVGLFTGDECLSGLSPIQGTELCAVAEQMYSYELLYAYTGDPKWAEQLEILTFNALPATISDDMWTHQYVQQSNQINCKRVPERPIFRTNSDEAHRFGLEPNYGCCTANFNQAWPKFALSAFMHRDNTIVSAVPVPSEVHSELGVVSLETAYPFENRLTYHVDAAADMTLAVRIPTFAKNLSIDGKTVLKQEMLEFQVNAGEKRDIVITFEAVPHLVDRPHDLKTVQCGSLVFALPIETEWVMHEYERNGVERKFPYCDYDLIGKSDWNYAFSDPALTVSYGEVSDIPFSAAKAAVTVTAKMQKISWGLEEGFTTICAKIPESRTAISEEETKILVPYGAAKLRMTEMPLI